MFLKKQILLFSLILSSLTYAMKEEGLFITDPINIVADNIDDLIINGVKNIEKNGELFEANAGSGQQCYDVNYVLTNPLNRVHNARKPTSIKYLSRELIAYFNGSLKVKDGLSQASKMWDSLADENGEIASNYGHYVFHQKLPNEDDMTQYDWVIKNLSRSLDSRKAFINVNQIAHKKLKTKDFPCTLGMQFFTKKNHLCCTVASRSTDIYTGLPYDMGFFSFLNELVYRDIKERLGEKAEDLKLGHTTMKTNFTQIYDKTRTAALKMVKLYDSNQPYKTDMPIIYDAQETIKDIYNKTQHTPVMKWIYNNAQFEN